MISGLKIGNFKAFGPAQEIPLRPITLVFGPNSAGKSSIIQSLLLARHIQDTGNADAHQTTLGGAAVDLGGFAKYVHDHDGDSQTLIEFTFQRSERSARFRYFDNFHTVTIACAIGKLTNGLPTGQVGIQSLTVSLDAKEVIRLRRSEDGLLRVDEVALLGQSVLATPPSDLSDPITGKPTNEHWNREITLVLRDCLRFKGGAFTLKNLFASEYDAGNDGEPVAFFRQDLNEMRSRGKFGMFKFTDWEVEVRAWAIAVSLDVIRLVEVSGSTVKVGLRTLSYLGPLRWIPPRLIPDGEQFDASWRAGGGDAWQRLRREPDLLERVNRFLRDTLHAQYRLRCRQLMPQPDAEAIERCVKRALERSATVPAEHPADDLGSARVAEDALPLRTKAAESDLAAALQDELRAQTTGEGLTELSLVDAETGLAVSHRDVGTGISQLLPVLVNAAGAMERLVMIEQPELHLHPALQAELGDVFIESALGENKNTFLIETHSEHLILRLLKRIRQTTGGMNTGLPPVRPEDVAILYVQPTESGSVVQHLRVDQHGRLMDDWPGGFFEESFNEMF